MKFAYIRNNFIVNVAEFIDENVLIEHKDLFLKDNNVDDIVPFENCQFEFEPKPIDKKLEILQRLGITEEEAQILLG